MVRRQITLLWGDSIIGVKVVRGEIPTFDPSLRVMVETLDDEELVLPKPPVRSRRHLATIGSALAHVGALAILATFAHVHPIDENKAHEERVAKMQGYLGRIAEHDGLAPGDVATDEISDAVALERGKHGGDAIDEGDGMPLDAFGHAKDDDRTPSLVPLAVIDHTSVLGTKPTSATHVSPSTLAPKLARKPRVSSSVGRRGGGGGGAGSGGASSCAAFANSPLHDPKSSTWIQFSLEDGAGRPVPNERYRVTLPDGSVHEGLTDARGLICFTGIDPGNAQITFPDVDTRYVGSSPKPI